MPGWRTWKSGSRGANSSLAKNGGITTVRLRRAPAACRVRSMATPSASSRGSRSSRSWRPTGVSTTARVRRSNSVTPSCSSSSLTWWLTADGVRDRRSAASLKLECRAARQKARSSRRGGIRVWATMSVPLVGPVTATCVPAAATRPESRSATRGCVIDGARRTACPATACTIIAPAARAPARFRAGPGIVSRRYRGGSTRAISRASWSTPSIRR